MKDVSLNPEVVSQVVSGQAVLLHLASEEYYGLDEVGTRIWAYLQEGKQPTFILKALIEEFDIDEKTISTDLQQLLTDLELNGLIKSD